MMADILTVHLWSTRPGENVQSLRITRAIQCKKAYLYCSCSFAFIIFTLATIYNAIQTSTAVMVQEKYKLVADRIAFVFSKDTDLKFHRVQYIFDECLLTNFLLPLHSITAHIYLICGNNPPHTTVQSFSMAPFSTDVMFDFKA